MATVIVRRPPRRAAPEIPAGELVVDAPPELPEPTGGRWRTLMTALPMLGGSVAMAMMFGRGGGTYSYVVGALFGVSSLAMLVTSWGGAGQPTRAEVAAARREYLRRLAALRRRARQTALAQRDGLRYRHPDPDRLWSTVDSHRLWERRASDPDFGIVRVALGPQALATPLVPPVTRPLAELEPMCAGALRRFLDAYSLVPDLPVAVSLRAFGRIHLRGAPGVARAMLAQLAVFHAPDDLVIAVCAGPDRRADWEWVKWLPHALHRTRTDAAGPLRLVAPALAELEPLLADRTDRAQLVLVLDGADQAGAARPAGSGVTVLDLDTPPPRSPDRATLVLTGGRRLISRTTESETEVGVPDSLTVAEAEAVARRLAPLRLAAVEAPRTGESGAEAGLAELLGLGDPARLRPAERWSRPRPPRDRLRVPIGVGADGRPVELDLKESAQDGMGPHGLLIGATGSGKSELLRTLVLGLAAEHSSETLNFVLVDFKGGATFASLDRLPHTAAVITNLADELPLVDRMVDAINGELLRRQELLRRSGNIPSLREYDRARAAGAALAPLPSLLIVCDEFSELLSAKPDFIDLFVQIGRVGRSLGVHLLLASQRLEEGRLRGLDTHLSYRIGLRTFSSLESRAVLGVPDAFELPRSPGHGYLRFGTEPLVRFRAAYASGPYRPAAGPPVAEPAPTARVVPYTTGTVAAPRVPRPRAQIAREPATRSLLDLMVDALEGAGPAAHRVWLPPLGDAPPLAELLGPVHVDPRRGLTVADPALRGALRVPVAVVDRPLDQRRETLWLDLAGAAGHVAVAGGPRSGKSTALRTLITALALTHTPEETQIYCLDFGGGSLAQAQRLPHVGGVAGRLDPVGVRRTVGEVRALLTEREARFAALGVDGMADYRARRASGEVEDDPYGDVFLVVDGWATLRADFDDLEPLVVEVAQRGLSYGVHVVVSAGRWMDLRPAFRDLLGARLELRLGDPADSTVSRRSAANVSAGAPGRGITAESMHLLVALPGVAPEEIAKAWTGPPAPPVRRLPAELPYAAVRDVRETGLRLPVGVVETDLSPAVLDFAADPHFLLFGDGECGKTSFLRALVTTITTRFAPAEARLVIVDFRRTLLGAVETDHLLGHASTAAAARTMVEGAAESLRRRLPGADVTARQLRDRSWWTGPELFVLVDDYELAGGASGPLQPLAELLPQARDIGLHLVLARRSGGAGRAYDPVLTQLRELSAPGLVMSGNREDGPLLGDVRPTAMPPGRGQLKTRREGIRLVQVAYLPPSDPA
ncbi:type VII secretion protein EccCa [Catenuloplanes atrovinosus]|uniref:S-DNA-T family DNA segregation ATPase FtsK/SpoIIIE n=1 Tax=Catenuloplanes atrovinosus TaxID=137266 RepID=A0AAE3YWW3_9ACTN|nr:type VII secretion protein EccCa [Catenuloplanes atrovinosus]MDR7280277.1 S-DNA-T family DNA segregation ATPase FtsK/SpoIIIE [Catenuloplanes atrovinosus]